MGFSADWLALREPADRAARDDALARRAAAAAGSAPLVVDLGCGTGATYRALSAFLPEGTRWRFVDNDPALLEIAGAAAGPTADLVTADLADLDALPLEGATLITNSALLDLVSEAWLDRLVARVEVPFYAAITYDGRMEWTPSDPRDPAMIRAFNAHQQTDKGLGPALGGTSADCAAALFEAAGFSTHRATSPWELGPETADLQRALVEGIAGAASEMGEAEAQDWAGDRASLASETSCLVGHLDVLALPAGHDGEGAP